MKRAIESYKNTLEAYEKALEFYGDPANYQDCEYWKIVNDEGRIARKALEEAE